MKQLLIIRIGSSYKQIQKLFGHYEQFFVQRLSTPPSKYLVCNAQIQPEYPEFSQISGVIISGAHENVTEKTPWMLHLKEWISSAHQAEVPILGVCFGHQLVAEALGGRVDFCAHNGEYGLVEVESIPNSTMFGFDIPNRFFTYASHEQCVVNLPVGAQVLAGNSEEPNHIVHFGLKTWGVQFHPEFTPKIMKMYLDLDKMPGELGTTYQKKEIENFGQNLLDAFVVYCQ